MTRQRLRVLILFSLFVIAVVSTDAQRRRSGPAMFSDQIFLISNYSDLNNHLEKENLHPDALLKNGVRGFQLRLVVDTDSAIIRMISPQQKELPFSIFLEQIRLFLNERPEQSLILFLDYNFPFFYLETALKTHQLFDKIYVAEGPDPWPSTSIMTEKGKQIVCFTLQRNQDAPTGFYYLWDYAVEPHFSTALEPEFHGTYARGRASNPFMYFSGYNLPRDTTSLEIPFLKLNINENPYLISHLINLWKKTGKRPNFILRNVYHPVFEALIFNLNSHNSISGNVTYNLQPLSHVSWDGSYQAITSGHYSFPFLAGEDLYLRPLKPGYRFIPERANLTNVRDDMSQNFIAMPLDLNYRLVAYYPFNNNARDEGPRRFHGNNSGVEFIEDPIRGQVALLQNNTFIQLPDAEKMGLHNNDFTVSVWLKTSPPLEERRDLTILGTEEVTYRQGLHLQLRNGLPYFGFYANDIMGSNVVRANEWVHVVWRYTKSTGEQAIFVNGRPEVISQKHPSFMGRGKLHIGRAIQMYNYMSGYLDDLAIWDRPLGNEEIWKLYQEVVPIYQPPPFHKQWMWVIPVLVIMFLIYWFVRRKKQPAKKDAVTAAKAVNNTDLSAHDGKCNSIRIFGEFEAIQRDGTDISIQFTPKVRQLFILLLLYSQKPKRGISSDEINQILWYGHTKKNATNNRGVNMSKLRQVLSLMDGVKIENQMENWLLTIDRKVMFCDYIEVLRILKNKSTIGDSVAFNVLFEMIERGTLLMDMEEEWLDEFKGHMASEVIDTLLRQATEAPLSEDTDMILKIADRIFMGDPFNEEALELKIAALLKQNHVNQAKYTYQWFADNYEKALGEQFSRPFDSFCNRR